MTLSKWQSRMQFAEIFPVSALKREMWSIFEGDKVNLQEGVKYFPDDMISDHGENFQIAEIIREKHCIKQMKRSCILLRLSWKKRKKAIPAWSRLPHRRGALLAKSILIGKQER